MPKILLVEDDSNLREIYGARLEAEGYQIVSARDGEEALALAIREHPDLIISDIMMPRISGFDMLDILRSTPETKDVKVIVMTALSQEEDRKRGEQLGANRYLVKSQVTLDDVVSIVQELLNESSAQPVTATPAPTVAPQRIPVQDTAPAATPAANQPFQPPAAVASSGNQTGMQSPSAITTNSSQNPSPASVDRAAGLTPTDEATLAKEVEQFVATSPLMNGTPPQPVSTQVPLQQTPTTLPADPDPQAQQVQPNQNV